MGAVGDEIGGSENERDDVSPPSHIWQTISKMASTVKDLDTRDKERRKLEDERHQSHLDTEAERHEQVIGRLDTINGGQKEHGFRLWRLEISVVGIIAMASGLGIKFIWF